MTTKEILLSDVEQNEYMKYLGIELLELEEKYAKGRMRVNDKLLNPYGTMHGGSLYSLADIVAGTCACMQGKMVATVSGNMNYLLPGIATTYIWCEAKNIRQGAHLSVFDIVLKDDKDNVLQTGSFTFFILEKTVLECYNQASLLKCVYTDADRKE